MTEAQYWKLVAEYATTEGANSVLLNQLREGKNKWNELFLQKLLFEKPSPQPEIRQNTEGYRNDAVSTDLAVRMRHLIGVKRSLSNEFFDHQDNRAKCAELSEKILPYERDIETLREQLRHYNEHGTLPPEPTVASGDYVFPSTKYELDKALRGVRSMISQVQQECEELALQGETAKLKKREKRLVDLKIRKEELETRLKATI